MNLTCGIALDTLSIVYMLILIVNFKHKNKRELLNRQYCQIVVAVCVFLALDIAYQAFYGRSDPAFRVLSKAVKSLYFVVNSGIVWLWAKYLDCILFGDRFRGQKHRRLYHVVFAVNAALVGIDLFTGIMFHISPGGTFVVNSWAMWAFTMLNYLSIVAAACVLLRNRKHVKQKQLVPLLLFPLPPLTAELVQIFYRPFSLLCAYAVSALIIFQVSQNSTIYTDELTGLANRRMFNESLRDWLSDPRGAVICGIMIDLDRLKFINDTYGHLSGDNALIALAEAIREVRRRDLVAARYGGDEFILIWRSPDGLDAPAAEQALLEAKRRINLAKPDHEKIEFSLGRFCCRDDEGMTAEAFLQELDERMYRCKSEKKRGREALS